MMQFGDILFCMDGSATGRKSLELALALARDSHARLVGYYLHPGQGLSLKDFPSRTEAIDAAAAEFERQLVLNSVSGVWVLGAREGVVEDIASRARCVDFVVAGLGDPDSPRVQDPDFEQLVIECGRPVLGIPIVCNFEKIGRRIMIAWDGSRSAARALHDAVPFLREATAVTIVAIDVDRSAIASPDNVVSHLKRMGLDASVDTELDLKLPIGEEILSRVERAEVDLLVAGAFGHSRLREHLIGGVSDTLLHQMMVPVLVSH